MRHCVARPGPWSFIVIEAFLVSIGVVTLAEIGDKTQLLALVLAARYRRPVPIILACSMREASGSAAHGSEYCDADA